MALSSHTTNCSLTFKANQKDTLLIPIPRDVEKIDVQSTSSHERESKEKETYLGAVIPPYNNRFFTHTITAEHPYIINFRCPLFPTAPKIDPNSEVLLTNDERFTKWQRPNIGNQFLSILHKATSFWSTDEHKVTYLGNWVIKHFAYSRIRDRYEYIDELIAASQKPRQDCLGYHATLVGLLRSIGIPAILDVGFRLTEQDSPHVWAWYFDRDKQIWQGIDLNDDPRRITFGFTNSPRISITLGTTHHISQIPEFAGTILSFVQYGVGINRITNHPPFTEAVFNITGH